MHVFHWGGVALSFMPIVLPQVLFAQIIAASSVFTYQSGGSYPTVPADVDYWSSGTKFVHNYTSASARIELEIDNSNNGVIIRQQTGSGNPLTWTTNSSTTHTYNPNSATYVDFASYRIWFGTTGDDSYTAPSGTAIIALGFAGADIITGSTGADFIYGGPDDDYLSGGAGDDKIWGGPDKDNLHGGDNNDNLYLNGGTSGQVEEAYGDAHSDVIYGSTEKDKLVGKTFATDDIDSDSGDIDTIYTVDGGDDVWGGPSGDFIYVAAAAASVGVRGGAGGDTVYLYINQGTIHGDYESNPTGSYQGADLIYVYGSIYEYTIHCGEGNDFVYNGGDHSDEIHGDAGNDQINAGASGDTVYGNGGADDLYGADGNDTLKGHADNDRIWGGGDDDDLDGGAHDDRLAGDEGTNGSSGGQDYFLGDGGEDVIWGEGGDDNRDPDSMDTLDTKGLNGGNGNDKLAGGDGTDNSYGDSGADILVDRTDGVIDTLDGGSGARLIQRKSARKHRCFGFFNRGRQHRHVLR